MPLGCLRRQFGPHAELKELRHCNQYQENIDAYNFIQIGIIRSKRPYSFRLIEVQYPRKLRNITSFYGIYHSLLAAFHVVLFQELFR